MRVNKTFISLSGDIRDATAVDGFVEMVLKEFGQIDILINNAGGQFPINAENLSSKGFEGPPHFLWSDVNNSGH